MSFCLTWRFRALGKLASLAGRAGTIFLDMGASQGSPKAVRSEFAGEQAHEEQIEMGKKYLDNCNSREPYFSLP